MIRKLINTFFFISFIYNKYYIKQNFYKYLKIKYIKQWFLGCFIVLNNFEHILPLGVLLIEFLGKKYIHKYIYPKITVNILKTYTIELYYV